MWCTACHVTFSWKTGKIETGIIHNPHFYQWQRENGASTKNPHAQICGGIPQFYYMRTRMRLWQRHIGNNMINIIMQIHRAAVHFGQVELRSIRAKIHRHTDNTDLRVKYLAKEIDEKEMKRKLATRDTANTKARAILDIYELFNTVITESIINIYNLAIPIANQEAVHHITRLKDEIDKISQVRCYCNKQLKNVSYNYRQNVKMIKPNLYTSSEKFTKKDCCTENINIKYFIQHYKWAPDCPLLGQYPKMIDLNGNILENIGMNY